MLKHVVEALHWRHALAHSFGSGRIAHAEQDLAAPLIGASLMRGKDRHRRKNAARNKKVAPFPSRPSHESPVTTHVKLARHMRVRNPCFANERRFVIPANRAMPKEARRDQESPNLQLWEFVKSRMALDSARGQERNVRGTRLACPRYARPLGLAGGPRVSQPRGLLTIQN